MNIFSMVTTLLILLHLYIFWRMRAAFGPGLWQLPVLVLLGGMLFLIFAVRGSFSQDIPPYLYLIAHFWMGLVIISALSFILVDMVRLFLFMAGTCGDSRLAALIPARKGGFLAIGLSLGLACFAYWQAMHIRPVYLSVPSVKISPQRGPLRIAAVSDIHLSRSIGHEHLKRVTDAIRKVEADILVFVGDTVDMDMSGRERDADLIKSVVPHGGGFAVLGNHEAYRGMQQAMAFLKRSGLRILRGASVESLGITIVGVDDPVFQHDPRLERETALLRSLDQSLFTVFLRHRPGYQRQLAGLYDLQLSGHTHGGQIWPGRIIVAKVNGIGQGLSTITGDAGQSLLYVLNGAGFWGPPMRLGSPPEVLVVDLVPASGG